MLLWGIFLPLGARYGFDQVLSTNKDTVSNKWFSSGNIFILMQLFIVYECTAIFKTIPMWTEDKHAIYYVLILDM
jgi:hypothetical protein